ncbi:hypothetical protein L207DRAFT_452491 [Hyaloscypha variabilis F]|uniref:Heterokaryon incompatibility domain-containing protein n=1 Tax=Hyaloscypha variabilis (strain UAMH 11265 / GT02V1 / F) TaxID=1149755 RepID=A0A2J6S3Z6_HYAVF|nr:hypothetical protein L207DRAFT_452491 [Hyaloscypha variabilis F]
MREIYSLAQEVLVWLGSGDRNTVAAIAAYPWSGFQARPLTDTELNGLIDIMQRPWWDRVWVVQEVCLAREAKVIVGRSIMEWFQFTLVMFFLRLQNTNTNGLDSQGHKVVGKMKEEQMQGLLHLGPLLSEFRWHRATNPLEKVYALLGLSSNPELLMPNYEVTLERCYTQTAYSIIKDTQTLDILENCTAPSFVRRRELPPWVPDWSYDARSLPKRYLITETLLYLHGCHYRDSKARNLKTSFKASGSSPCSPLLTDGTTLVLSGLLVDTIKHLNAPVLLGHIGMNLCSGRGVKLVDPSAPLQVQVAAKINAIWLNFTHPILLLLAISNMYRIGKLLVILLSTWDMVHPLRDGEEAASLEDVLSIFSNNLMKPETISTAVEYLAEYRAKVEGGNTILRISRKLGVEILFPPLYTLLLGFVGSAMMDISTVFVLMICEVLMFGVDSRIGITTAGRIARVPWDTTTGDQIVLLRGGKTPFVVRKALKGEGWRLVGAANVKGMMGGELWSEEKCCEIRLR